LVPHEAQKQALPIWLRSDDHVREKGNMKPSYSKMTTAASSSLLTARQELVMAATFLRGEAGRCAGRAFTLVLTDACTSCRPSHLRVPFAVVCGGSREERGQKWGKSHDKHLHSGAELDMQ